MTQEEIKGRIVANDIASMFHGLDLYDSVMLFHELINVFKQMTDEQILQAVKPFQDMLLDEAVPLCTRYLFIRIATYLDEMWHLRPLLSGNVKLMTIPKHLTLLGTEKYDTPDKDILTAEYIRKNFNAHEQIEVLLKKDRGYFEHFDDAVAEWHEKQELQKELEREQKEKAEKKAKEMVGKGAL